MIRVCHNALAPATPGCVDSEFLQGDKALRAAIIPTERDADLESREGRVWGCAILGVVQVNEHVGKLRYPWATLTD